MKTVLVSDDRRYKAFYNERQRRSWSDPLRQDVLEAEMEDAADVLRRNAPPWMQDAPFFVMVDCNKPAEGGDWPVLAYVSRVEFDVPIERHIIVHAQDHTGSPPRVFSEGTLQYKTPEKPTFHHIWNYLPLNWSFCIGAWAVCALQVLWNVARILASG